MKSHIILMIGLMAFVLSGCAKPTQEEMQNADYGMYPSNYKKIIENHLTHTLKDPYSAQYEYMNTPTPHWHGWGGSHFGYVVCVRVNAKNSYGGYAGFKTHFFMIKNGDVIKKFGGGDEYNQAFAAGACKFAE